MNKKRESTLNEDEMTFNGNFTAIPRDIAAADDLAADVDLVVTAMEYGPMNLKDARESGYTDDKDRAVSLAYVDVTGSPTGAYTDIGAGRSSVVHKKN